MLPSLNRWHDHSASSSVSTARASQTASQIRDLIAAGCAERDIYTEQASSVREWPELDLLRRRILRPGDELVVTRLDRLARSARDTLALAEELGQHGVTLKILDPAGVQASGKEPSSYTAQLPAPTD